MCSSDLRTLSGKKLEVPVRKILLGADPGQAADPNALANPDALGAFSEFRAADPSRLHKEITWSQRGGTVVQGSR